MIVEEQLQTTEEGYTTLTIKELRGMIKECIRLYFLGKTDVKGNTIPDRILVSRKHVDLVLNTTVVEAIKKAYKAFKYCKFKNQEEKIINTLNSCAKYWIPKDFAGGMMLIYLSLCEGVPIE